MKLRFRPYDLGCLTTYLTDGGVFFPTWVGFVDKRQCYDDLFDVFFMKKRYEEGT